MIQNPIFSGFNADPCICRKGDDFYVAVSSFEWFPGIPVYHSKDLKNWELYTHVLQNDGRPVLRGLPSAKGIWAPCLTYCEEDDLFYVVYGVMNSMNARYFDVENYVITAKDIKGPWSEPVYLHSLGFDASIFHDANGKKYVVALEWETREKYEKPGQICLVEYDSLEKKITGPIKKIWRGGTDRGCIEGPHITKRGDYYYIMCAEGGTGYYHSVTMGRSKDIWGPYEPDPQNPILTSNPVNRNERADWDHLKERYFNPEVHLQKAGHGSYVDLPNGETWMVCHVSRPFVDNLRCTLGRETAIQRMKWTDDGWLRMENGGCIVEEMVKESELPEFHFSPRPQRDDFNEEDLQIGYYTPRLDAKSFTDLKSRRGWLRMRGQESGCSLNRVSIVARKLTSLHSEASTRMEFHPECYQQTAGLIAYYDNMNFIYLHKTHSEAKDAMVLSIIELDNGKKIEHFASEVEVEDSWVLDLKLSIKGKEMQFYWTTEGKEYTKIGSVFDISKLSDEYSQYGEFTGTFIGITCGDRRCHEKYAEFDWFELKNT